MDDTPEIQRESRDLLEEVAVEFLRRDGTEVEIPSGETILRRGDSVDDFWVILEGEVEVRRRSKHDGHLTLARRGPGGTFGEVAILRSAPVSADVIAVTPVRALRYPATLLPTALTECESLRRTLLTRLADGLHRTADDAWGLYRRTRALAGLLSGGVSSDAMVAVSARMRAAKARLLQVAPERAPVLVTGEAGTGKMLAARVLHGASGRGNAPLVSLDCREMAGREAGVLLFGGTTAEGAGDPERYGALHFAHGGTLVLRGIDRLAEETQRELARHLTAEREVETVPFPDVRLVFTLATEDVEAETTGLLDELRAHLGPAIDLPPLYERRRDILPLARSFLAKADSGSQLQFTPSAERALVSRTFRNRNVDELRSVVELAVRVADGHEIRAEHVFSGFAEEKPIGLDVSEFWLVRWLVAGRGVRLARLVVAAFFFAAAGVCLAAGSSVAGRFANGTVWVAWEPVVFGLFLLVGSLWCTVCPLSSTGRLTQRWLHLDRPPPGWILQAGGWLSAIGLVLILWSEEYFHMVTTPVATGMLLVALVAGAVVCCILWQREVWCRHLCPLGRLGVALAPVAPLTVAARPSMCASTCTTHDCYKGNEREPGCPVYHHPQLVTEAHHCKMCLTCLSSCPHGSTGLFLRPRLRSAWRLTSAESYVIPLALTVFFLAPVLVVAQRGGLMAQPLWLTLSCGASLVAAAALAEILTPLLKGHIGQRNSVTARVSCALLVLGWGPLMAYQMGHIPLLSSLTLVAEQGSVWDRWPGPEVTAVTVVRVAFVIFAAILSATILWNARGYAVHSGERINAYGWAVLILGCTVYTFVSLWLVV
jgi:CRP-like cAMP-binding protein/polyferredoxin